MSLPASSYVGRHAELYDLFYADKPYAQETDFIHACLQRFSPRPAKRLLELACGTGTHAIMLEKHGYQIVACDYSADMLAQARRKAEKAASAVDFRQQDMRNLDIADRPFDAVCCLFDSIGYVATNESILRVLRGVQAHLRPGGLFIFEFWHAAAMIRGYEPVRIRRWQVPEGEVLRLSETSIDHASQLCHVTYSVYELGRDGRYQHFRETQINRFFLIKEMESFLTQADLTPLKWFAGFRDDEGIDEGTWHVVAVSARRGNKA